MQLRWKRLISKTGFWLTFEVWLNLVGLDNLADYNEFVFVRDLELAQKNHRTVKVANAPPKLCKRAHKSCPIIEVIFDELKLGKNSQSSITEKKYKKIKNMCIRFWCISKR